MHYKNVAPLHLPSFLLPCPHCGSRLAIMAIAPARLGNGAASNNLEDVTHTCVQCGMVLVGTRRPFSDAMAHRGPKHHHPPMRRHPLRPPPRGP
jgi:hypothetical protein